jgi:hypothetical protein
MKREDENIVPKNEVGSKTDTIETVEASTLQQALALFEKSKQRLLDINKWSKIAGTASAKFNLTDATGEKVTRAPQVGDFFQIDVPAPGTDTGDGYDWVRIEAIEDNSDNNAASESVAIKVRPCSNPTNNKEDTAHFFKEDATSTFIVERNGNKVTAEVHGRNEIPNTDADKTLDKVRNAIVGLGAVTGVSKLQWKNLVKGLLQD